MPQKKPRYEIGYGAWIATALALALGVTGFILAQNAPGLIASAIHDELAARGFENVQFEVEDVAWGRLRLTQITIGDPVALRLPEMAIGYSFSSLFTGQLDEIQLKKLEIEGNLGPDGLSFEAFESLIRPASTGARPPPRSSTPITAPEIPVERIEIDDARIHIATDHGPLQGELWISLDDSQHLAFRFQSTVLEGMEPLTGYLLDPFSIDGEARLEAQQRKLQLQPVSLKLQPAGRTSARLTVHLPAIAALQEGGIANNVRLTGAGGAIELGEPEVLLEDVGFEIDWNLANGLPKGRIEVARVRSTHSEPWVAPLQLQAILAPHDSNLTADLEFSDLSRRFAFQVRATQDLETALGSALFRLPPFDFGEGAADLDRLLPGLHRLGVKTWGSLAASGRARWGDGPPKIALDVALRNVGASIESVRVSCLNGVVSLQGPPFETDGGQEIFMEELDIGLPLREGHVRFHWKPTGEVYVERGEWSVAGGKVITAGAYDPTRDANDFLLAVDGIQVGELTALTSIEGLSGTGRVSGRLPIRVYSDRVEILGGVLASEAPGGWIRYRPTAGSGRLAEYGVSELVDLESALEDFKFTEIELRIDGDTRDELAVQIRLAGANPTHLDGQPYVLNLNVEGQLVDLIGRGTAAYQLPLQIQSDLAEAFGARPDAPPAVGLHPCKASRSIEAKPAPMEAG